MSQKLYYVDSCIWLNLFKKEGDPSKGIPYWKIAEDFIEQIIFSDDMIMCSGFVFKEIKYNLNDNDLFKEKEKFLKNEPKINFIKAISADYDLARKLESISNFTISFFDCMHIDLSYRLGCVLITRDALLIEVAKKYIAVTKPENLFR